MKPERLFAAFVILYFSAALVGKIVYSSFLGGIRPLPLVYALMFLLLLFVGFKVEIRISSWIFFAAGTVLLVVLGWPYLLGGLAALALLKFLMDNNALERGVAPAVVVSIALVIIASVLGGVPLLNPSLRFTWVRYLYLAAGYITVGCCGEALAHPPHRWGGDSGSRNVKDDWSGRCRCVPDGGSLPECKN